MRMTLLTEAMVGSWKAGCGDAEGGDCRRCIDYGQRRPAATGTEEGAPAPGRGNRRRAQRALVTIPG
jgi:hypothetical protein